MRWARREPELVSTHAWSMALVLALALAEFGDREGHTEDTLRALRPRVHHSKQHQGPVFPWADGNQDRAAGRV